MTAEAATDIVQGNRPVRILHLEDSALDGDLVCAFLRDEGIECEVERVWNRGDFEERLRDGGFDLILADHQLPDFDGETALALSRELAPDIPFVFVSGTLGEEVAVEALKRGATDYVVKQRLERLAGVVRRALAETQERAERRRAEAALERVESDFATLVDAMPQLCWMANADGFITWYNRRWYDYTGATPEEMEGWGWIRVHDPVRLPEVRRRWQASIDAGEPFEMVFPLRGADGSFRPFLTRAEPVKDGKGRVQRWLGTNTDVSAQHKAEEELRRLNDTLESRVVAAIAERERALAQLGELQKLETIGQLTGGVAHDFNNLLTPILGNLDLLRRRLEDDEKAQRLIGGALQGAERAKTLVQRLLAFARRQVLDPRPVDVAELVEGLRDLVARSIGPEITFRIEPAQGLPPARIDPNQLELAILNLAVNARDAMPEGGTLRIIVDQQTVGRDHPSEIRHGDYIRVAVSDTGAGMDATTMRHAIEPFFSTKGVGKGTGLGLSMVHGLAAQSGGALRLSSTPGEGTCAEIWLPVASETLADSMRADGEEAPAIEPISVLLVDDENIARAATAEMLRDLGHAVSEARSGLQALQMLKDGVRPDLVITDYLMPGMTGMELVSEVKTLPDAPPILMITGYAQLAGHQIADLPLLPKPFRQIELAERIARIMVERSALDRKAAAAR